MRKVNGEDQHPMAAAKERELVRAEPEVERRHYSGKCETMGQRTHSPLALLRNNGAGFF